MSNELTPQQKYPKFYESPHLWIGAIEVQGNGDKFSQKLNYKLYAKIDKHYSWPYYKPLFKPQEGEQFIKDLEQAVSLAVGYKFSYYPENTSEVFYSFRSLDYEGFNVIVAKEAISHVSYAFMMERRNFNTAAYVDTLRKLGYYL